MGPWVPPGNALVCSSPHIKELVSAEQLARLQGKFFVHPSLAVLHDPRSELRKLLHIREFDPQEVRTGCVFGGGGEACDGKWVLLTFIFVLGILPNVGARQSFQQ